ncbi:MAG TPA: hypothetical protein VGI79_02635 [Caulobacteraceae bacterium]|jgi:hypothetical protein
MNEPVKPGAELTRDHQTLLTTWVNLPPVARQMIAHLLEQVVALERQGDKEIALAMLEDIHLRLVTGKTCRSHH